MNAFRLLLAGLAVAAMFAIRAGAQDRPQDDARRAADKAVRERELAELKLLQIEAERAERAATIAAQQARQAKEAPKDDVRRVQDTQQRAQIQLRQVQEAPGAGLD
jgi:hypothetical protein